MPLYAIKFELEDFGQNVSHIVRKTYYSYDFFTDGQVYAGISKDFDTIGRQNYQFRRSPCTLAIPLDVKKEKIWFSMTNTNFQKEQVTGRLKYLTEGYQEYMLPGSKYLTFSFIKPNDEILFIGKKSALATIDSVEEVNYTVKENVWTTLDLVYSRDYDQFVKKEIFMLRLVDASQRFLVGQFKTSKALEVKLNGDTYRFYSLWKYIVENA